VEPALAHALHELLDLMLISTGAEGRRHPRVARRMDLQYGTKGELRAMLADISRGGLSMIVDAPLVLDEEIFVQIPDEPGGAPLVLYARVVNQRTIERDDNPVYRVGLEFEDLSTETWQRLKDIVARVL
jgi:hypothetical protein